MAALLRERLRESDLLGRLGGDEFAVLLLRADRDQAQAVAGQLLGAIRTHEMRVEGKPVHTTASIGIALLPEHASDAGGLLAWADNAMYRAKEGWSGSLSALRARHASKLLTVPACSSPRRAALSTAASSR